MINSDLKVESQEKWSFEKKWGTLKLLDTATKIKHSFIPVDPECVYIYVCGITPYEKSHIGHGRSYINFDLMIRMIKFMGYNVVYIRNYTDIDDKLLKKAEQMGHNTTYLDVANYNIEDFQEQMKALNCLTPTYSPRATECIDQMIDLINTLVNKGAAYYNGNDVCYSVRSFDHYGKLSGKNIDQLIAGQRVSIDQGKIDAADFVLWKGNDQGKFWESPFGYGRPGWHIECSAMIKKHCPNRPLDIHGGGMDLIFPHHENEIAQSEAATDHKLSNLWVHNQLLSIKNEKMSKSLGNSLIMNDLFVNYKPMDFRFYILQHGFDTPIEFSFEGILSASKAFAKLGKVLNCDAIHLSGENLSDVFSLANIDKELFPHIEFFNDFIKLLLDNLNSGAALGLVFKELPAIKDAWLDRERQVLKGLLESILGLNFDHKVEEIPDLIKDLIAEREQARVAKDFKRADQIRIRLDELGYKTQDKKI